MATHRKFDGWLTHFALAVAFVGLFPALSHGTGTFSMVVAPTRGTSNASGPGYVAPGPISSTLNPNDTITLTSGGVIVELETHITWDDGDPGRKLGTAQWKINGLTSAWCTACGLGGLGFDNGIGAPLEPLGFTAGTFNNGGYINTHRCFISDREGGSANGIDPPCNAADPADGPAVEDPAFAMSGQVPAPTAVVAFPDINYEYLLGSPAGGGDSNGGARFYGGTLRLDIPAGATGTYEVGFVDDPFVLILLDERAHDIPITALNPAFIKIRCQTQQECDDGNLCTDENCDSQTNTCTSAFNYDDAVFCCDPNVGPIVGLTQIDDNTECTDDVCDPATGNVTHGFTITGTACGDQTATECDAPNICDGAGTCVENHLATGTACGDPADKDCDSADTCDDLGTCLSNLSSSGTPCGDNSTTECTNPDICDGMGICNPNDLPLFTPCTDDGDLCTNDHCVAGGICAHPPVFCINAGDVCCPADGICQTPVMCNPCDDGNACTDDVLNSQTGTCTNTLNYGEAIFCCDPNIGPTAGLTNIDDDNDCTVDICDPATGIVAHDSSVIGTPCDDNSTTDCTKPDSCDGMGTCLANDLPNGTPCMDDGDLCTNDHCIVGGVCAHPPVSCSNSGDVCCPSDGSCQPPAMCDPCIVVSTDPPNCEVDAGQPHPIDDDTVIQGWKSIAFDFFVACTPTNTAGDFSIRTVPGNSPPPAITSVVNNSATTTVNFGAVIPTNEWTCVTHTPTMTEKCIGFLPADVNKSLRSNAQDITSLINSINGVIPRPIFATDVNRSGPPANPQDITGLINLLNGAGMYAQWNDKTISALCPS